MKLSIINKLLLSEAKKEPVAFTYRDMAETMWRKKFDEATEESGVNFDLENDEAVDSRELKFPGKIGDIDDPTVFLCELRSAGGDWECCSYYFRCQLVKGSATRDGDDIGCSGRDDGPYFCFIPGKDDGNNHLENRGEGEWGAPDAGGSKKNESKPSETKCWAALKKHLEGMAKRKQPSEI